MLLENTAREYDDGRLAIERPYLFAIHLGHQEHLGLRWCGERLSAQQSETNELPDGLAGRIVDSGQRAHSGRTGRVPR